MWTPHFYFQRCCGFRCSLCIFCWLIRVVFIFFTLRLVRGGLWEIVVVTVVVQGRWSYVDVVTLGYSPKKWSDAEKWERVSLAAGLLTFPISPFIKLSIVFPVSIDRPLHSHAHRVSQVNSQRQVARRRATQSHRCGSGACAPHWQKRR